MRSTLLNLALLFTVCLFLSYRVLTDRREQGQLVIRKLRMPGTGARSVWGRLSNRCFSCEYRLPFHWRETESKCTVGFKTFIPGQTHRADVIQALWVSCAPETLRPWRCVAVQGWAWNWAPGLPNHSIAPPESVAKRARSSYLLGPPLCSTGEWVAEIYMAQAAL